LIFQKRIIGIDVGTKRIGLAQSDPTRTFASPIGTFSEADLFKKLLDLQQSIELAIVGWPISMRGHEGSSTKMVQEFVNRFTKNFPGIKVELLDERFTSTMANKSIVETVTSRKKRQEKGLVDTVAASILLQSYLDRNNRI
jgi:putative Holliday junction resolvase